MASTTNPPPLDPERFARIAKLFQEALAEPTSLRDIEGFVASRVPDDRDVARELSAMLRAHVQEEEGDATQGLAARTDALVRSETQRASDRFEEALPKAIGPFRILRRIATGGMGTVYEAEQDKPKRRVALKVVRADQLSPEALARFDLEGNLLARLSHPGIAKIHAMGRAALPTGAVPYIAMEYVDGESITAYAGKHGLDADACIDILCKVADALSHAHDSAILHRDIKPSNILVSADGEPRLLDFGIARALSDDATQHGLTSSGLFMGTLNYMSPEQARGTGAPPDVRADLYGLAAVGYEMLAGRPPHDFRNRALHEATADLLEKSVTELRQIEPDVPRDLSAIFAKALSIEPARRYASVRQFADDLQRYRSDQTVRARPPSRVYRAAKFVRRHRTPVALTAAVVLSLVVGLFVALGQRDRAEDALAESQRLRRLSEAQHRAAETESALHAFQAGDLARAAELTRAIDVPHDRPIELRYLHAQLADAVSVTKIPRQDWVLSPHGRTAAASEPPHTLHLLDVASNEHRTVDLSSYPPIIEIWGADFVDGKTVVVHHRSSGVTLVDVNEARIKRHVEFDPQAPAVDGPPWTPITWPKFDGGRWWDLASGRPLGGMYAERAPDGWRSQRLSATHRPSDDSHVVIDRVTNAVYHVRSNGGPLRQLDATGRYLLMGFTDLEIWDLHEGTRVWAWTGNQGDPASWAALHRDARRLAVLSYSGVFTIHDIRSGTIIDRQFDRSFAIGECNVAFEAESDSVVAVSSEGHLARWNTDARVPDVLRHARGDQPHEYVYAVAWHPRGRWLASAAWDNRVLVWDTWTSRLHRELPSPPVELKGVSPTSLAWSPDGSHLLHQQRGCRAVVWHVESGRQVNLGYVADPIVGLENDGTTLVDRGDKVGRASLGPEPPAGELGFGGNREPPSWAFDPALRGRAQVVLGWDAVNGRLAAPAWGLWEVDASRRRQFALFEAGKSKPVWIETRPSDVLEVKLVDGGKRLLAGLRGGLIEIWDVDNRKRLGVLRGHASYVISLALSPDGRTLASGSGDGTVRLWRMLPRTERQQRFDAAQIRGPK